MKLKHTPGPWVHTKGHIGSKIADFVSCNKKTMDGMHIHNGEEHFGNSSEESEANARLISAAPEMLDALIYFVKRVHAGSIRSKTTYSKYVDIIEKATGMSIEEVLRDEQS